jgi:hypothetical protein
MLSAAEQWTTASDLARFIIGIELSLSGCANMVVSQVMPLLSIPLSRFKLCVGGGSVFANLNV